MLEYNNHEPFSREWTLFLDRDGVINIENPGTYVTNWTDFRFCEGTLAALAALNRIFGTIVVVTNQRGVGRGIMTMEDLKDIHTNMSREISENGGRVDRIYSCTAIEDTDHNRKPNTGMAMQAQEDFRNIDFKKSVMVGNSLSDMVFGKRMAMHTVFLTTVHEPVSLPHDLIDQQFGSLKAWSDSLALEAAASFN